MKAGNRLRDLTVWTSTPRLAAFLTVLLAVAFPTVLAGRNCFVRFDFGVFGYPLVHYARESFWRGELPLWNPLSECGVPFLAQWNTMVLYPFSLVYDLLPLPWSLGFFCLAHLVLGGAGMYRLLRVWTGEPFAAAFGGTLFTFSGVMLSSLVWPHVLVASSWMPWLFLACGRSVEQGGRAIIPAVLAGTMQMLSGVPEIILPTWLLALLLTSDRVASGAATAAAALRRLSLVVLLVAGLSAAQLLPFLDLLSRSQRDPSFATGRWAMPAWGLANLVVPLYRYGETPQGLLVQEGQGYIASYYFGAGALALALAGIAFRRNGRRRVVLLLAIPAVLCFLFAAGETAFVYPAARRLFPPLGLGRYPIKSLFLAGFLVPALAALGLECCLAKASSPQTRVSPMGCGSSPAATLSSDWS